MPFPLARYTAVAAAARTLSEGWPLALVLVGAARDVSGGIVGLHLAAATLPQILVGPVVGAALDRSARPARVLAALGVAGAAALTLTALGLGRVPVVLTVAAVAVLAGAEPALTGGLSATATTATDDTRLEAWDSVAYNIAGIAAPIVVAVGVAAAGVGAAAGAVIAVGLLALAALPTLPLEPVIRSGGEPPDLITGSGAGVSAVVGASAGVGAGVRVLATEPVLRAATAATTIAQAAAGGLALAVVAAAQARGRPAADGAVLATALALGALAGSLAWTRRPSPARPLPVIAGAAAVGAAALALAAAAPWPAMVALAALAGVADGPLLVATFAARRLHAPPHLRAVVFTAAASLKLGAGAVGAVVVGLVVASRPTTGGLLAVAALTAVAVPVALAGASGSDPAPLRRRNGG